MTQSKAMAKADKSISSTAWFFWSWTVIYRSQNSSVDDTYASVWATRFDTEYIRDVLHPLFPDIERSSLPTQEEDIRHLVRDRLSCLTDSESDSASMSSGRTLGLTPSQAKRELQLASISEESWDQVPSELAHLLASLNMRSLQQKLDLVLDNDSLHCKTGKKRIQRSTQSLNKTMNVFRNGFKSAASRLEQILIPIFIIFLVVNLILPNVAAGFLNERSYNHRSVPSRIVSIFQLYFIWRYPNHSLWLIFNWSLERVTGALLGNWMYSLAAVVPALHRAYTTQWFKMTMLGLSLTWQILVQFSPAIRDCVERFTIRRQMRGMRARAEPGTIDWSAVDQSIASELQTLKGYTASRLSTKAAVSSSDLVPVRVRIERYLQFSNSFKLGRPADQLMGLLKDDLEAIVETYEDYQASGTKEADKDADKGHVEPRTPKFILVGLDVIIFAYICYSFYTQPFTFNTVVAYGTVVVIKQTILAFKRYQTPKAARRIFTNMVSINVISMLLVSTPVAINRHILDDDLNFALFLVFTTIVMIFFAEPIAPLMLKFVEGVAALSGKLVSVFKKEKDCASVQAVHGSEIQQPVSSAPEKKDPVEVQQRPVERK